MPCLRCGYELTIRIKTYTYDQETSIYHDVSFELCASHFREMLKSKENTANWFKFLIKEED